MSIPPSASPSHASLDCSYTDLLNDAIDPSLLVCSPPLPSVSPSHSAQLPVSYPVLDLPDEPPFDTADPPLPLDASHSLDPASDDDLHFDDDADPDQPPRPGFWRVDHSTGDHRLRGRTPS
jgi:hypothetical protein